MNIKKYFKLLGFRVEDKVTGYTGVVTDISFDLYGCIQAVIKPPIDKEGKILTGRWYDVERLEITSIKPVVEPPVFTDIEKCIRFLGLSIKDKVTEFSGIGTSISFNLSGVVDVDIKPPVDKEGKNVGGVWFAINRLKIKSKIPVMKVPSFEYADKGPSEKSMMRA